jgi:hypothetical protein
MCNFDKFLRRVGGSGPVTRRITSDLSCKSFRSGPDRPLGGLVSNAVRG